MPTVSSNIFHRRTRSPRPSAHHSAGSTPAIHSPVGVTQQEYFQQQRSRSLSPRQMPSLFLPTMPGHTKNRRSVDTSHGHRTDRTEMEEATLHVTMESPPLVMYGPPEISSGALLSGRFKVHVPVRQTRIRSLVGRLVAHATTRRPVHTSCSQCATRTTELTSWSLLTEETEFYHGDTEYPFSFLFPGNLPPSTHSALFHVTYELTASMELSSLEEVKLTHPINVSRSILPAADRHSLRVFPPTALSANIVQPSIYYTHSEATINLILHGISQPEKSTRWRLRKIGWRIDETCKVMSMPCATHAHKVAESGDALLLHDDTRSIGSGDLRRGWKTDFEFFADDKGHGRVECEFNIATHIMSSATCDMQSANGSAVHHVLVIELVVAEENVPKTSTRANSSAMMNPTGAARVLRMQFPLILTERPGLGISWDDEVPPTYDMVPGSPPGYIKATQVDEIPTHDLANALS